MSLKLALCVAVLSRDVLDAPIPDRLVAILRQMALEESDHERPAS